MNGLTGVWKAKPACFVDDPDFDVRSCAVAPVISIVGNGIRHGKYHTQYPGYDNRQHYLMAEKEQHPSTSRDYALILIYSKNICSATVLAS